MYTQELEHMEWLTMIDVLWRRLYPSIHENGHRSSLEVREALLHVVYAGICTQFVHITYSAFPIKGVTL